MSSESISQRDTGRALTITLLIVAAFVLVHPYTGIRHDGTLYAGDALARLLPDEFRDDLYFFYGSQGRFTLLPAVYAALISMFGLGPGTMVGMLASFAFYLAATWYLVNAFSPRGWRAFCILSVVLGWTVYGGNRIFGYSEPFLTARSFAEPIVLFGLGLLVRGRLAYAIVALLVALVVHPLIATGGWLAAWVLLLARDRRWAWTGVAGATALAIGGWTGIGPFSDVFARYDAEWLALVHEANGHAFVSRWSSLDYGIVVFDATILWLAYRRLDSVEGVVIRRLAFAAGVAGVGAMLASLLLVDILGNPFFGKLQIWRCEWVLQWTANAALPLLLKALWEKRGEQGRVVALLLAIGWMAPFSIAPGIIAALSIALDLIHDRIDISRITVRLTAAIAVIIAAVIAVQYELRVVKFGVLLDQPVHLIIAQALTMNLLILAVVLLLILRAPRWGAIGPLVALAVLITSFGFWDQRGAWTRRLESYATGTHIWPGLIEPTAKVYWYRDLLAPWVLLGHSNYYTQQQGSGAVFSRDMVVELDHRRQVTAILDFQEQICRMMNNLSEKQSSCEPDALAVKSVCVDGKIDYIVLQSSLDGAAPIASYSTGVIENGYEKKFFLYRCSALKSG